MDECEVVWRKRKRKKGTYIRRKKLQFFLGNGASQVFFPMLENNYRKYGVDYTLKDNQKKTVMNHLSGGNSCDKVVKRLWQ